MGERGRYMGVGKDEALRVGEGKGSRREQIQQYIY